MSELDLGIVGNGTVAGLVNSRGDYQWLCLPRYDGEPVFNQLLGGKGTFSIWMEDLTERRQSYDQNTAILRTRLTDKNGASVEVIDFAPRFQSRGRTFRPASIVRRFRVLSGAPRIRVSLNVETGWGAATVTPIRGGEPFAVQRRHVGLPCHNRCAGVVCLVRDELYP